ncbi:PREDICTED: uncharacterized protein LOC105569919 isoform X2 [Vollenhovia emeryi]|nr:PREDICTED: uncharacterized protein LOC105569919 isoform X2 [Vollenhovia emeryi]XP_011882168.1 PREDICTED: uncharacterized protein LOC105569919 isoform X2 [Vollenhovia emeryi]
MSPTKRKTFVADSSDEDDSFKCRRSSLRVNLSYSEDLSDSGNGSLWKTEIENEGAADDVRTVGRLSRGRNSYEKSRRSDPDDRYGRAERDTKKRVVDKKMPARIKGAQVKRLTINLEDISIKERNLETSCKRLKDAILCKTKQIFDRENELSVKTSMVLGSGENSAAGPNVGNETVTLDVTDRQRKDRRSDIVATPTTSEGWRSLEKIVDKSRLTQRRLFAERDRRAEEQPKCRIVENVVLKNLPLLQRQVGHGDSPILSGSNRRLSLHRARPQLHSQKQLESPDNTRSTVHSVQNTDNIGVPVVCSTFIEDSATADKGINKDLSRATYTTNKVISMEMTEVHGGIEEHGSYSPSRNSDANNCSESRKRSKESSIERDENASGLEDVECPANKITVRNNTARADLPRAGDASRDVASVHVDTVVSMQAPTEHDGKTKYRNERRRTIFLSDSSDTARSSLNVNTSLDGRSGANQDFEVVIHDKKSTVSNNQHEDANTIRTSLQVNTSVDSMRKTWQGRSDEDQNRSSIDTKRSSVAKNKETNDEDKNRSSVDTKRSSVTKNKETSDIDSLENISLMERMRNISIRKQVPGNDQSNVSKMRNKRRSSNSGGSYSYVEGTPYPISRSVLFRSQLKHATQHIDNAATCNSDINSDNEEENDETKSVALHSKVSNEMHTSTGTQETMKTTVATENIPSCDPFVLLTPLTIVKDMLGTRPETDERNAAVHNAECIPAKKGKRRLLPINEASQYSISPVSIAKCTPEESTSTKRHKKLKKRKLPKRKSMRPKNNTSNIKQDVASNTWSDDDCDMPENEKKQNKKTQKPRKVISKKIVVKKFADKDVLNALQRHRQNRDNHLTENEDSLDDFAKCRTISTQRHTHKSQRIVIVTTGLSHGDKSLVKSIVKSLGAAETELNVSRRTTHVVSTGVRTVNLLRGIIRGCWLVTLEWVLKSLENNAWLDPETFEMKHFSKAVQENRQDRQLFGPSYIPELFTTCGLIYVERRTTVPCDTLKELIRTAGGHVTEDLNLAKITIGASGLKETWIIDSITTGELQLTKLYQRK